MPRGVSRSEFQSIKQGYRDTISSLKKTIESLKNKPVPKAKPVGITDEARLYRDETDRRLQKAEDLQKGFDASKASILLERNINTETFNAQSAALAEQRKTNAADAATRSANQRRSELTPSLQIQPAGETPTTGGTQPFRKRKIQSNKAKPYESLAIKSQSLNV